MKIECILDYNLVKEVDLPDEVMSKLVIPDVGNRGIMAGEVIAAGPGIHQPYQFVKNSIKEGDLILFPTDFSNPVRLQGVYYRVLRESQIIAKLNLEEEEEMTQINDEIVVGGMKYPVPKQVRNEVMRTLSPYAANAVATDHDKEFAEASEALIAENKALAEKLDEANAGLSNYEGQSKEAKPIDTETDSSAGVADDDAGGHDMTGNA